MSKHIEKCTPDDPCPQCLNKVQYSDSTAQENKKFDFECHGKNGKYDPHAGTHFKKGNRLCTQCGRDYETCLKTRSVPQNDEWQNRFLVEGSKNGLGDLSIMIGIVSDILSQAIQKGRHDGAHEMDLRVTENFNRALKDENSELIEIIKEVGRQEERSRLIGSVERTCISTNHSEEYISGYKKALQDFIIHASNEEK